MTSLWIFENFLRNFPEFSWISDPEKIQFFGRSFFDDVTLASSFTFFFLASFFFSGWVKEPCLGPNYCHMLFAIAFNPAEWQPQKGGTLAAVVATTPTTFASECGSLRRPTRRLWLRQFWLWWVTTSFLSGRRGAATLAGKQCSQACGEWRINEGTGPTGR